MPVNPEDGHPAGGSGDVEAAGKPAAKPKAPFERRRFGGSDHPDERENDDVPVSRSDLTKGPGDLVAHGPARINWSVLLISSALILAFSLWAIALPEAARTAMRATVSWIATNLGWFYVVTVISVIGFVLWVAFSKEGGVRLGPDRSRPQYGLMTWVAHFTFMSVSSDNDTASVLTPLTHS